MSRIRVRLAGVIAATAVAGGILGFAAPAQAAPGRWIDLGWYQYKSSCDADGKKEVNRSKTDSYTDWMCERDSPGYRLYIFEKW
ncbi:hypothetical protein SAMN05421541_103110 [Actinoplanes philippinensis]|uniref:Uncharacterized protein n=1 Tax=Actinoplanes philippinensis TaxID=35752 RepID=A0A1I2CNS1_9ACTN|nr:hypothetical protein [Actinoplanes philippinensis]SFE69918.1 hypothetical protein SAMN05421541_103110 [Actinoplanes philippinensis]